MGKPHGLAYASSMHDRQKLALFHMIRCERESGKSCFDIDDLPEMPPEWLMDMKVKYGVISGDSRYGFHVTPWGREWGTRNLRNKGRKAHKGRSD